MKDDMVDHQSIAAHFERQVMALRDQLLMHRCLSDCASGTVRECVDSGRCGCCNGLLLADAKEK